MMDIYQFSNCSLKYKHIQWFYIYIYIILYKLFDPLFSIYFIKYYSEFAWRLIDNNKLIKK